MSSEHQKLPEEVFEWSAPDVDQPGERGKAEHGQCNQNVYLVAQGHVEHELRIRFQD